MNIALLCVTLLAASIVGLEYYMRTNSTTQPASEAQVVAVAEPFLSVPDTMPSSANSVVVLAPRNCTREEALRAEELAKQLEAQNIPVTRSDRIQVSIDSGTADYFNQVENLLAGQVPVVIVNGEGKANPTLEEVVAKYRGAPQS